MAFGTERLARRMLGEAKALNVPVYLDDVEPITRVELFRAGVGHDPDPWQEKALESDSRKLLFLCSRQSGKSTVSACRAAHEAATRPGALVLVVSPSLRQSGELFRSCRHFLSAEGVTLPAIVKESALRCELENGARIIALPGSETTVRGYAAATLVIIDEASRVPDELMAAIRPTLATTGGVTIALSTPAGKRGWFYLEFASGVGWERTRVTAADCGRISQEFLDDELRLLGPHIFDQEYGCEFFDPDSSVFSSDLIGRAISSEVKPLWSLAS